MKTKFECWFRKADKPSSFKIGVTVVLTVDSVFYFTFNTRSGRTMLQCFSFHKDFSLEYLYFFLSFLTWNMEMWLKKHSSWCIIHFIFSSKLGFCNYCETRKENKVKKKILTNFWRLKLTVSVTLFFFTNG